MLKVVVKTNYMYFILWLNSLHENMSSYQTKKYNENYPNPDEILIVEGNVFFRVNVLKTLMDMLSY